MLKKVLGISTTPQHFKMDVEITIPVRLKKTGLREKLDKIIEQEKARGHTKCSYADAAEILSRRIDQAGGLKE